MSKFNDMEISEKAQELLASLAPDDHSPFLPNGYKLSQNISNEVLEELYERQAEHFDMFELDIATFIKSKYDEYVNSAYMQRRIELGDIVKKS